MEAPICAHNQRGHCKWGQTCHKHHINTLCPSLSTCKDKLCKMRHPKTCKNLALDGFCRFGELCSYSHRIKQSPSEALLTSEFKYFSEAIIEINTKLEVLQAEVLNLKNENEIIKSQLVEGIKTNCHTCCHEMSKKTKLLENKSCKTCSSEIFCNTSHNIHKTTEHKPEILREHESNKSLQLSPPTSHRSSEIDVCPVSHTTSSTLKKQTPVGNLPSQSLNPTPNIFSTSLPSPQEISEFKW